MLGQVLVYYQVLGGEGVEKANRRGLEKVREARFPGGPHCVSQSIR